MTDELNAPPTSNENINFKTAKSYIIINEYFLPKFSGYFLEKKKLNELIFKILIIFSKIQCHKILIIFF